MCGVRLNENYSKSRPVLRERGSVKRSLIPIRITLRHGLFGFVRMDNVIEFPSRQEEPIGDPVIEFIQECLLPWAMENDIDVHSMKFKLNGATIMTCLQGMLLDDI